MLSATDGRRGARSARRAAAACAMLALALATPSCALISPPAPPQPPAMPALISAAAIAPALSRLAARAKSIDSLQTPAVMEYSAGDQHVKAREQIVARRPASLRVDAMSPFGVALILAAEGQHLAVYEPSDHRLMRAAATADTLNRYVRIPMEPADAVRLLMGLAPEGTPLDQPPNSVMAEGAMTVASWSAAGSETHQLGIEDGRLVLVRELGGDGRARYEVRYGDYHDIGGVMFPYLVDADFPVAGSHVTLRYGRPIINGAIPDTTFVLTPAGATEGAAAPRRAAHRG
jgi:hypothetical protein